MPVNYKLIGQNVQIRRKHLHITQQKMADDLFLSASLISKLERGVKAVSLDTLTSIAEYLNTTAAFLLTPPNDPEACGNATITEINAILEDLEQPHLYIVNQLLKTYYDNIKIYGHETKETESGKAEKDFETYENKESESQP